MARCGLIKLGRKYFIIFFGLLLIFIWLHHKNISGNENSALNTTSGDFNLRLKHLRGLVRNAEMSIQSSDPEVQFKYENPLFIDFSSFLKEPSSPPPKAMGSFVHSDKCQMPQPNFISRQAVQTQSPSKACTVEPDLFQLTYNQTSRHYQLQVNRSNAPNNAKSKGRMPRMQCNYREVARSEGNDPDMNTVLHPPVYFTENCRLPRNISAIIVECRDAANGMGIVQQDAFSLVQAISKSSRVQTHPVDRQPSVIILGLGSMSRMNFHQSMPKTSEFVRKEGWFELEGYNKVSDNDASNMLPVLSGLTLDKANTLCDEPGEGCLDKAPWIWKDFKKAGYETFIAEDSLLSLFHSESHGFQHKPTDQYLRPLLLAVDRAMSNYTGFGLKYCVGRRLSISYVFDFCTQFTSRYVEEQSQPVFGLLWSSTFTSDDYFAPSSLDEKFLDFLHSLEQKKLFKSAIVILMSDSGARSTELLEMSDSILEERLPMLHIFLPPWFLETYPKYGEALSLNRNQLCSNFDLHNTLRHFLRLDASTAAELPALASCPKSQSLLFPLPEERSCEDACIGEHWCTCEEFVNMEFDTNIYSMGKLAVFNINRWMLQNRYNEFCQRVLLADIIYRAKKMPLEDNSKQKKFELTYRLAFQTSPQGGKFLATFRYSPELRYLNMSVPDISRLDSYKNDSYCVENDVAKKFCFCYPKENLSSFMREWKNWKPKTLIPDEK